MQKTFWQQLYSALFLIALISFVLYFLPYILGGMLVAASLLLLLGVIGYFVIRRKMRRALSELEKQAQNIAEHQASDHFQETYSQNKQGPIIHVQAEEIES